MLIKPLIAPFDVFVENDAPRREDGEWWMNRTWKANLIKPKERERTNLFKANLQKKNYILKNLKNTIRKSTK